MSRIQKKVLTEATRPGAVLKKITGKDPGLFAYPFGVACPEDVQAVKQEGYQYAFLANDKLYPVDFSSANIDPFRVQRTIVYKWNIKRILQKLATRYKKPNPLAQSATGINLSRSHFALCQIP